MRAHKKIALIRNSAPEDVGGAEKYPILLSQSLPDSFDSVITSANQRTRKLAIDNGAATAWCPWLPLQDFSGARILFTPLYLFWQLFLVVWYLIFFIHGHFDVVHIQSKDDFIAATIAGKLLKKRVIWTDHADLKYIYLNNNVWFKNPIGKIVYLCSFLADYVVYVSKNEKKLVELSLSKKLDNRSHVVIYNGVLDQKQTPNHARNGTTEITATSRLVVSKGLLELIKAFKGIDGDLRLNLYGSGADEDMLKKAAEEDGRIIFHGFCPSVYDALKKSDIFVHPSYNEGFSISLVEAAMMGLPIITTDVGGNPEIIHDNITGLLVEPRDVDALRSAMKRLIDSPRDAAIYGLNARKEYLKNYQFDQIVINKLVPLYE
jgi:glycosyltransferase involved in cell wall biosynthesis